MKVNVIVIYKVLHPFIIFCIHFISYISEDTSLSIKDVLDLSSK